VADADLECDVVPSGVEGADMVVGDLLLFPIDVSNGSVACRFFCVVLALPLLFLLFVVEFDFYIENEFSLK
jgi:hypothetical protein